MGPSGALPQSQFFAETSKPQKRLSCKWVAVFTRSRKIPSGLRSRNRRLSHASTQRTRDGRRRPLANLSFLVEIPKFRIILGCVWRLAFTRFRKFSTGPKYRNAPNSPAASSGNERQSRDARRGLRVFRRNVEISKCTELRVGVSVRDISQNLQVAQISKSPSVGCNFPERGSPLPFYRRNPEKCRDTCGG